MTIDRTQVSANSWLQFDPQNQEFYGIPLWGDKSFSEYQLVSSICNLSYVTIYFNV